MRQIYLSVIIFVLIVHANTLYSDFSFDDQSVIVNNQQHLNNPSNISKLITRDYFYISKEGSYRPIITLSYFWDQYWGNGSPFQYHLSNLLLHLVNTALVLTLFLKLTNNQALSMASTVLYSIHPVLTEAVNGIGFRDDLLAAMFIYIAILAYMRGSHKLSLISYAMALLSKEIALILPILLLVYDRLYGNKTKLKKYIGYISVTALYAALRFYIFYNPAEMAYTLTLPLEDKLNALPMAIFHYLKLLLFPASLSADYAPYDFLTSPHTHMLILASLFFLFSLVFLGKADRDKYSVSKFGLCWFYITLLPVMNIIAIGNPFAERYLYIPAAGFILFVTSSLSQTEMIRKRGIMVVATPLILIFSILTIHRNTTWRNDQSLWQNTALKAPFSYRPYLNLSDVFIKNKDYDNALLMLEKTLDIKPDSAIALNNLGVVHFNKMEYKEALNRYNQALTHDPSYAVAYLNRAMLYEKMGKIGMAQDNYLMTIEFDPDNPKAHLYLGILYGRKELLDNALKELKTALGLDPYTKEAHYNLGIAYELKNMHVKAREEYLAELSFDPFYSPARLGLVRIYTNNGQFDMARAELKKVLDEFPKDAKALEYLNHLNKIKD